MIQLDHATQFVLFAFAGMAVFMAFAIHLATHGHSPKKYDLRGVKSSSGREIVRHDGIHEAANEDDPAMSYRPVPDSIMKFAPNATSPGELTRTTKTYFFEKPQYTGEMTRAERQSRSQG